MKYPGLIQNGVLDAVDQGGGEVAWAKSLFGDLINTKYESGRFYEFNTTDTYDTTEVSSVTSYRHSHTYTEDVLFNDDGSKFYAVDVSEAVVIEYSLSTNYDISTRSENATLSTNNSEPAAAIFNDDGTKLIVSGTGQIEEHDLSTGFDITSASLGDVLDASNYAFNYPNHMSWNTDGSKFYVGNEYYNNRKVFEYSLSTPFDITTLTHEHEVDFGDNAPTGVAWNQDGTKLCILFTTDPGMAKMYEASTAFDLSTITEIDSTTWPHARPRGLAWTSEIHYP